MNLKLIFFILFYYQLSIGQTTFFKTFGDTAEDHDDVGHTVLQTEDGGYIIAGETGRFNVFGNPNHDYGNVFLVKTDEYGDTLWTKTYGDTINPASNKSMI